MAKANIQIPEFTAEDFLAGDEPYEFLMQYQSNAFVMAQLQKRMALMARSVGVGGFTDMLKKYIKDREVNVTTQNVTDFHGQRQELFCGSWSATDHGIVGVDKFGMPITACYHPIIPVERLVNVDTGIHKVKLEFKLSSRWRDVIVEKSKISDARSIISLAEHGVNVTSDNAKHLVKFLADVEHLNYNEIPETPSAGRLGWIDGYGFSPYFDGLTFDGEDEYRTMFESVKAHGQPLDWMECVSYIRENDTWNGKIARIALAASFASVLVKPVGNLPFFVHVWGGTGLGKTVLLMLAASVWADPENGKYIQTFNSTDVGKEMCASFCNSLPLLFDELQLVKDNRKDFDRIIYQLTEGVGRTRGKKTGGIRKTPTWRNCFITTGEYPLLSDNSGGGSSNRTIELELQNEMIFKSGPETARKLLSSYGHAGKWFVDYLSEPKNMEHTKDVYEGFVDKLKHTDSMEKQAASAALILTADKLVDELIFQDGHILTVEDLALFLTPTETVDQNARALEFVKEFVAMNSQKFGGDGGWSAEKSCEIWGRIDGQVLSVIKSKFAQMLQDNGYNWSSFCSWAKRKGILIQSKDGRNTVSKYVGGGNVQCVCLRIPSETHTDDDGFLPL